MRGTSSAGAGSFRPFVFLTVLSAGLVLAACSDIDEAMFGPGSPSDETAAAEAEPGAPPPSPETGTVPGTLPAQTGGGAATVAGAGLAAPITPITIEPGSDTGTSVGQQVSQLRTQLSGLQDQIMASAQQLSDLDGQAASAAGSYHDAKAQITTKLQMGTTRGNPELVSEWNAAQSSLDQLTGTINGLSALGTQVAGESSRAHYILDTIQSTYQVSGAVDEDHRQLAVLEDETNQTIILIDRVLKEVSSDVQRQTAFVGNERANLTTLASAIKNGELYGGDVGLPIAAAAPPAPAFGAAYGGTPLVTVRFDRPDVQYQQILYTALAQALQSRPDASFAVVAESPTRGTAAAVQLAQTEAKRHAQDVLRSLTDMGVPPSRVTVASATDPGLSTTEVRVYVR